MNRYIANSIGVDVCAFVGTDVDMFNTRNYSVGAGFDVRVNFIKEMLGKCLSRRRLICGIQ